MANPGTSAASATPEGRTADDVIQMYEAIKLRVCDDAKLVKEAVDKQYARHQRDSNSPDRDLANRAKRWMRDANDLQDRRKELLELVYGKFRRQSDVALQGAISAGMKTLTDALVESLRSILREDCRVDDDLNSRFLNRFFQERSLSAGKEIVKLALPLSFTASGEMGRVSLQWTLPPDRCDKIEIVREGPSTKDRAPFQFDRGTSSFDDVSGEPGKLYTYRIYSIFQGVKTTESLDRRATSLGEVRKAAPASKNGQVELTWEAPNSVPVVILRKAGLAPSFSVTPHGMSIALGAEQVYRGGGSSFIDTKAEEGVAYHYKIVADFGENRFSGGVDLQWTLPKRPTPVLEVLAAYRPAHNSGKDEVGIEWKPAAGQAVTDYTVVRREGETAPAQISEGFLVATTSQTRALDQQVVPGKRYTYAVFPRAGDLYSRIGTASRPVDILAEVADVKLATADGTVDLHWTTPSNAFDVIVLRSLDPPRDHTDAGGVRVQLAGHGHAKDTGLRNDRRYHYLVCCAYRPTGAEAMLSRGIRVFAEPTHLPDTVENFVVEPKGTEVHCSWTAPLHGQAVVIRSAVPLGLALGHRLSATEIDQMGERVTGGATAAVDLRPAGDKPHYTVFTVAGAHAVVGRGAPCVVCPDVDELTIRAQRDGVVLRWSWPQGCTAVRVMRRRDSPPVGAYDAKATPLPCTKAQYDSHGGKFVDRLHEPAGVLHYRVYAQAPDAPAQFFSPGTAERSRAEVRWDPAWTTIRYRFLPAANGESNSFQLRWNGDEFSPGFSGFALVANREHVPEHLHDGVELLRRPGPLQKGEYTDSVSSGPAIQSRWNAFFVKMLPLDPAESATTLIVHPDLSRQINAAGFAAEPVAPPLPFRHGVPKSVICPSCFESFALGDMLYRSFGGAEDPIRGRYGILERLKGLPPQPPVVKGQRLNNKICPKCGKPLPFTAGAQESRIIGLIGAKYSGKSHYITTLIEQLGIQVGADMHAAFMPVSDETSNRFRMTMRDPLYKDHFEVGLTVGTPPPLIYDLRMDGRLWGEKRERAITLPFYETAGETLDTLAGVEEFLAYLRVAAGVVLLIDPLQSPAIRQIMPKSINLPPADASSDPAAMISRVLQIMKQGGVTTKDGKVATPLAVVLAKSDALLDAGIIESSRLWSDTSRRHIGYFDQELHDDTSGMAAEIVRKFCPEVYNNVTRRFDRYAFFCASATGCSSNPKSRRYSHISPIRVEDPVLWLLSELGIIPAR